MNRLTAIAVLLLSIAASALAADVPRAACQACGGVVSDLATAPAAAVPLLIRVTEDDMGAATQWISALGDEQQRASVLIVDVRHPLASVQDTETQVAAVGKWIESLGHFRAAGISAPDGVTPEIRAYMVRRVAVLLQGRQAASQIVLPAASPADLAAIGGAGAGPYYDIVLSPAASARDIGAWLAANDPSKRQFVTVARSDANPLYDIAKALDGNVTLAFLEGAPDEATVRAVAAMNASLRGDFSRDPSADARLLDRQAKALEGSPVVFVRGEDLRTLVVPPGSASEARILSLPDGGFVATHKVTAAGEVIHRDTGRREGRFLVGVPAAAGGLVFTLDRPTPEELKGVLAEKMQVSTQKGISVDEIIRNHQAYWSFQQSITPRYVAKNQTDLRFSLGPTAERFEASISGPEFFDGERLSDWLWQDFYVNGVKWKYGEIPELPIVQAQKVTQLPLEISLTNEYRYTLAGEAKIGPFDTWEVRFTPPDNAPANLPLYRGTVWIDKRTYARVRISMIELNLTGDVLSNEESTDYVTFDATKSTPLSLEEAAGAPPRSLLWLPGSISMQMVVSTASRPLAVERKTTFSAFQLQPVDFDAQYKTATESKKRMVRDTDDGLRYLVKDEKGDRVVQQGFKTSQLFLVGGVRHDEGQKYPVLPLAGINYFDWKLGGRNLQTNVFFAGVILAANLSDPALFGTRAAAGVDVFGLAVPFDNTIYRNGEEAKGETVQTLPFSLNGRVSHPLGAFLNVAASMSATYVKFGRSSDTSPDFVVPVDTWVLAPGVDIRFDRWGYSLSGFYEYDKRTKWEPWGRPEEYSDAQKDFQQWGVTFAKGIFLPKFQRIGFEMTYEDGRDLDRFSKYELGFFGTERVRGIRSQSVRAERALLGHLSYGFVFSDQFRVEAFYDLASLTDRASSFDNTIFQGVGLAGQTVGPWGTLLRFDLGKTIGPNKQSGFAGSILFLKLFG